MSAHSSLKRAKANNGYACVLVEKWNRTDVGWKKLKEIKVPCRLTAKRIYVEGAYKRVFNRDTGIEIQDRESRIFAMIRYTVISTLEIKA